MSPHWHFYFERMRFRLERNCSYKERNCPLLFAASCAQGNRICATSVNDYNKYQPYFIHNQGFP